MLFSHVTLLTSKGELAYWGPRGKLLPFLEGLEYRTPSNYNPADFLLELVSTKKISQGKALALAADSLASHEQALSVTVEGPLLVESQSSPCLVADDLGKGFPLFRSMTTTNPVSRVLVPRAGFRSRPTCGARGCHRRGSI